MSRSISKHVTALNKPSSPPPPPAPFSNQEAGRYYNEVMLNLPQDSWRLMATRLTALQVAENQCHMDRLNAAISEAGIIDFEGKPHPGLSQLVKLQSTSTAMLSRLKALPSGDAREAGRAAKFEASIQARRAAFEDDGLLA